MITFLIYDNNENVKDFVRERDENGELKLIEFKDQVLGQQFVNDMRPHSRYTLIPRDNSNKVVIGG